MKRYWDASALIDAIHDSRVEKMALEPDQWTRPHALSEVFSQLTGGRLPAKYLADDAAALIEEVTEDFSFVELSAQDVKKALSQAQAMGVRSGRVHDWLQAVAARIARVAELLTDNMADFAGLDKGFTVAAP
ncbi:MAG: hypothetical protein KGR98_05145 [Verrucomicrobia bacterium]|nr:hypothetical protein [Verrucomicrobiota bacterium]MDE3098605.1 hypothetical protein [Verrucomicrobiota bacterium]